MADNTNTIQTQYPLPVYNYQVEIDSDTIAFSEISGLATGYDTITYHESTTAAGTTGPNTFRMPGIPAEVKVTMSKGYVRQKSIEALYDWISSAKLNVIEKKDIIVRLCDENGDPVVSWTLQNAFPTTLSAPSFKADGNEIAIETMELIADGVTMAES